MKPHVTIGWNNDLRMEGQLCYGRLQLFEFLLHPYKLFRQSKDPNHNIFAVPLNSSSSLKLVFHSIHNSIRYFSYQVVVFDVQSVSKPYNENHHIHTRDTAFTCCGSFPILLSF